MARQIDYAGKAVIIGSCPCARAFIAYRVTSSSYPCRSFVDDSKSDAEKAIRILPGRSDLCAGIDDDPMWHQPYFDPYVCLRTIGSGADPIAFASNGNQVNRIYSLAKRGCELKTAIATTATNYDYERWDVARVYAGLRIPSEDEKKLLGCDDSCIGILGVHNPIEQRIKSYTLEPGKMRLVGSTPEAWNLEETLEEPYEFDSPESLARFISEGEQVKGLIKDIDRNGNKLTAYVACALQHPSNKSIFQTGFYSGAT